MNSNTLQAGPTHELAHAIHRLYSCEKEEERKTIMDILLPLGKYICIT